MFFIFTRDRELEKKEAKPEEKSQEELRQERLQDVGFLEEALEKKNKDKCLDIKDDYTKDQCYKSLAQQELEPRICEEISDDNIKSSCLYFIYFQKALMEKSVDPCYNLDSEIAAEKCAQRVQDMNFCATEECYNEYFEKSK